MRPSRRRLLALIAASAAAPRAALAAPATFFVDPAVGRDDRDGRDPSAPRRSPPVAPPPGARILFRGGARLQAPLKIRAGGALDLPVIYAAGSAHGYGSGPVIVDGWSPLDGWRQAGERLWTRPIPEDMSAVSALIHQADGRYLALAQSPAPPDPFDTENTEHFFEADTVDILDDGRGVLFAPGILAQLADDLAQTAYVRVHVVGNWVRTHRVIEYDSRLGRLLIDSKSVGRGQSTSPLDFLRTRRFAVINHRAGLSVPGTYVVDHAAGLIVLHPHDEGDPNAQRLLLARGHGGIEIMANHVRVEGFHVEGIAADAGVRVGAREARVRNVTVSGVEVSRSAVSPAGITVSYGDDCLIYGNQIHDLDNGRGLLAGGSRNVIKKNHITRVRSTGLSVFGGKECLVIGNHIGDPMGTHANGMSFYIDNIKTKILFNTVFAPNRNIIGIAIQNAESILIAFNTFVVRQDRAAAHHPNSRNGSPDRGGHVWANNLMLTARDNRAWNMHPASLSNTTIVNNIADGISFAAPPEIALRSRNLMTRQRDGVGLRTEQIRMIGDMIARRSTIFRNLATWDLRPSPAGARILAQGHPIMIEGRLIDWIGRYRPDGSEAWDWDT